MYYHRATISTGRTEEAKDRVVMKSLRQLLEAISRWIDCVAAAIVAMRGWFVASRPVELIEEGDGEFSLRPGGKDAGSRARPEAGRIRIVDGKVAGKLPGALAAKLKACRAEIVLQPGRFMFRPLELPRRAGEFLDGIVRSQVDRLTPWSPAEAAFGWSPPTDAGNDRITVTVAATARALITPLVEAVAGLGADSIVVSTHAPSPTSAVAIKVLEHTVRVRARGAALVRRTLFSVLIGAGLVASAAVAAQIVVGGDLDARQLDVGRRIATRRMALRAGDSSGDTALAALERRKHETPASVIVLEALSQILPDHTYKNRAAQAIRN